MRRALWLKNKQLFILDQTRLPTRAVYLRCRTLSDCFSALRKLQVRGAPLIGVFAGYAVYVSLKDRGNTKKSFPRQFYQVLECLRKSRPTAVNLFWALKRMEQKFQAVQDSSPEEIMEALFEEASAIHREDIRACTAIGKYGLSVVEKKDRILTHCNAGFLATSGDGTALSVFYQAQKAHREIRVYNTETRPLLQGSRLTAWELLQRGIRTTLLTDNMAGFLMQKKMINKIIVGADRITAHGDVANKVGTYSLAVLAAAHKIPFYVAAPCSTFDRLLIRGEDIPIEERNPQEVKEYAGKVVAPLKVKVWNPAFDITPSRYITGFITDYGIIRPPFLSQIRKTFTHG